MCVNNLSKVALDSAAAGIELATFSRKSNALTTAPPSHTYKTNNSYVHNFYYIQWLIHREVGGREVFKTNISQCRRHYYSSLI